MSAKVVQTTGWVLVLEDNFQINNFGLPTCLWDPRFGWGPTMNNELQYYTDPTSANKCNGIGTNHIYTGNSLKLIPKYDPGDYEVWIYPPTGFDTICVHYNYTSGMLWSKQRFLYGLYEMRCKIPFAGMKLFPAFWLFAGDPYREIDIFEFDDPTTPNNLLTNIHIDQSLDFGARHPPGVTESNNSYPDATQLPDVGDYHTYAVQWRVNSVTWLVDGIPVRTQLGHSPPQDMHVIINVAMANWRPAPDPADLANNAGAMEIDFVRVYRNTNPEFLHHWDNGGDGKIASWNMNPDDRHIAGNFDGGGRTLVLAVAATNWAHMMRWDGVAWQYVWGNAGANKIALWQMKPDDSYVVGDFDGDGRDEILVTSSSGWAHLMRWDGSDWQYVWGNNGNGQLAVWNLHAGDRLIAGDYDGSGGAELLAVAAAGWAHLMRWDGSDWQYVWGNDGSGAIGPWNIHGPDRFVAADFDADGKAELLCIAAGLWSHLLSWDGSTWQYVWGNGGSAAIGSWQINPTDRFLQGDFDGSGRAQIVAIAQNGWSHAMDWDGTNWRYLWGNDGANFIHRWAMKPSDTYVAGAFAGAKSLVFVTAINGWAQILHFGPTP